MDLHHNTVTNLSDFVAKTTDAKSPIQSLIKSICREVNRQKPDYRQLSYAFRIVRERCGIEAPNQKKRRLRELPTVDELKRFYDVIDDPIHRLIFEMMENTGLRVSELCNLQVSRIDFDTNLIFVSAGKGDKDRVVVMGNVMKEKLKIYLANRRNKFLFESNRCTKFTPRRIEQLCLQYKELSGIAKILTPHIFRHVLMTRLAMAGLSEEKRAILAGHSDSATQQIYTHLSAGGFKNEVITHRCSGFYNNAMIFDPCYSTPPL
jgi:site-specific recombinase XerD